MLIFIWNLPRCVSHNAFLDALYMKNACYFGLNLRQHQLTTMREREGEIKVAQRMPKKSKVSQSMPNTFFRLNTNTCLCNLTNKCSPRNMKECANTSLNTELSVCAVCTNTQTHTSIQTKPHSSAVWGAGFSTIQQFFKTARQQNNTTHCEDMQYDALKISYLFKVQLLQLQSPWNNWMLGVFLRTQW